MPFWHGDAIGRPIELGRAIGSFLRELEPMKPSEAVARLRDAHAMDDLAANNLVAYLGEQTQVTGALPTDRTIVVERFRDELGDWRVVLLTPFGGRVHAPWSMAIEARLREQHGLEVQSIWSDDGIAVRLPEGVESDGATIEGALLFEPDEIEDRLMTELGSSALFAARFRENAARALLLPRRRPGQRTPLWMQRQRSADLLAVASQYGSFPIILETYREVLRDVFDMPALRDLLADIRARRIRVVSVESRSASPFASSLLFDYVGSFMYEGDAPLAERRAQALTLDRELLAELLGSEELRELIDPEAVATSSSSSRRWRRIARRGRSTGSPTSFGGWATCGPMRWPPASTGLTQPPRWPSWRRPGAPCGSASAARSAGSRSRMRRAIATRSAPAHRRASLRPSSRRWIARWTCSWRAGRGRTRHSPPTRRRRAGAWLATRSKGACVSMAAAGELLEGAFRAGGAAHEFTDADVLRQLRRRSLARLRREVEPVEPEVFARFLPAWHGVASTAGGLGRLIEVVAQLEGVPLPSSGSRARRAPGQGGGLHAAAARRAWCRGRGGLDRARITRPRRRSGGALPARPRRPAGLRGLHRRAASRGRSTTRSACISSAGVHPSSRSCVRQAPTLATTRSCSTRSGTSCGPERSRTTRSRRFAPSHCHAPGRAARRARVGAVGPRSTACRGALVAGRRPRGRGALAHRARTCAGRHAARSPRGRDPRGGRRRGAPGGYARSIPCCGGWRNRVELVAATSWRDSGRRSSRCPARSIGCGAAATTRRHASPGRDRPGQAVRRGAALARGADDERLPLQRAAGAYVVIVDGHARAVSRAWRARPAAAAGRRRPDRAASEPSATLPSLVAARRADARAAHRARRPRAGRLVGPGAGADRRSGSGPATAASCCVGAAKHASPEAMATLSGAVDGLGLLEDAPRRGS